MKKPAAITVIILLVFISFSFQACIPGNRKDEFQLLEKMGSGINLGNSLDTVAGKHRDELTSPEEFETFWHNPPVNGTWFSAVKANGFDTVRIPVSWGEHQDGEGVIDSAWMERVREVVDLALANDLYVILNTHHEDWLMPTYDREEEDSQRLCRIWEQISREFAEYDEKLLFEGMNEPRLIDTDLEWGTGTEESRQVINELNRRFVETVRSLGGNNATRYLLITDYAAKYKKEAMEALVFSDYDNVIVSIHCYAPHDFTSDEKGEEKWSRKKDRDTGPIDTFAKDLKKIFINKGIPVLVTEYGCNKRKKGDDREDWAKYFTRKLSGIGVHCIWWDNGDTKALIDRETGEVLDRELIDIITHR